VRVLSISHNMCIMYVYNSVLLFLVFCVLYTCWWMGGCVCVCVCVSACVCVSVCVRECVCAFMSLSVDTWCKQ
jgi:hypothetical protein